MQAEPNFPNVNANANANANKVVSLFLYRVMPAGDELVGESAAVIPGNAAIDAAQQGIRAYSIMRDTTRAAYQAGVAAGEMVGGSLSVQMSCLEHGSLVVSAKAVTYFTGELLAVAALVAAALEGGAAAGEFEPELRIAFFRTSRGWRLCAG